MDIQSDDRESKRVVEFLWYWGPVALYAGLIFYLSSQSHPEQYVPHFLFVKLGDKVLHAVEYAVMGFLCYRAFRHAAGAWGEHYAVLLGVVAATVYGATDEWHQAFVPFRESDRWDLATDLFGALLGVLMWSWIENRRTQTRCDGARAMEPTGWPTRTGQSAGTRKDITLEPGAR